MVGMSELYFVRECFDTKSESNCADIRDQQHEAIQTNFRIKPVIN
jgi:hypothetical protein